ncbi:hypothetical protein N9Y67_02495 [Pseudomonadota bacterium]|nr:hypothetical protein [Pseudomonadota bacterium]
MALPNVTSASTFWAPSHSVSESFSGTGINSLLGLDLSLGLNKNFLTGGSSVNFDVLVNNTSVGSFFFSDGDKLGQYKFSFSFPEIIGNGTYNLALQVLNTVPYGRGSIAFSEGSTNFATLSDGVSSVPVPAALFMFVPALLGFMGLRRKAKSFVA